MMRLAALYSGGKDSTFALYLAHQMGHEISFLVNIVPSDEASWLFHTPNLDIVPCMSEALDIPLITAASDGSENGDMDALRDVLSDLDIEGVIVGALWSDYQWDRMNLVLGDLDLVMVAPLWRKDQDMVYDEMVAAGIEAVIVGTFADGLGEEWLGRPIDTEAKKELLALRERYGISIMGEGGEYESLTLDSPMHNKRLKIVSSEKDVRSSSGTMKVTGVVLEDKSE